MKTINRIYIISFGFFLYTFKHYTVKIFRNKQHALNFQEKLKDNEYAYKVFLEEVYIEEEVS